MELTLGQVQKVTGGTFEGDASAMVHGWSIDSRTITPGDLFIAFNSGHQFIAAAFEKGAIASITQKGDRRHFSPPDNPFRLKGLARGRNVVCPLFRVEDTLLALQQLAHYARRTWSKPIIAITGSAGKTTTKDIIASLLSAKMKVGKTTGNFNNHIGLPLSLLRIPDNADAAVLEMGMNHAGEIRDLCRIASPDIGVVTNVGYAHVENFDSIEGIAAAKRELIESLPPTGIAVLNADDPRVLNFSLAHGGQTLIYSLAHAKDLTFTPGGATFTFEGTHFKTSLTGTHNVSNILAGITVAQLFGIQPSELTEAVAALTPGKMRGERHQWNGITILNDAYNSNPEAARQMLDLLRSEPATRRIAVLGEMLELGSMSERLHRELGEYATGLDLLIGIHGAARFMVEAAPVPAQFFETPEQAGAFLKTFAQPGDTILFKGSRGTHVESALATMESQP